MFGNCPRPVWEKWASPDERNRIALASRALLVQEPASGMGRGRNVLLEAGVGAFFEPKLRERFGIQEDRHVLLMSRRCALPATKVATLPHRAESANSNRARLTEREHANSSAA